MEVEVDINRDDYLAFNNYVVKHKISFKKFRFITIAVVIIFICIISIRVLNIRETKDIHYVVLGIFFIIIIYTIISTILILISKTLNTRFIKRIPLEKGGILGKHKFKIENDGLRESTEYNDSLLKWKGIKSVETTNKYIFIFVDKHMAHIIPKRYFESEEECKNFLDILKSKTETHKS